jgi:hypothetical protein
MCPGLGDLVEPESVQYLQHIARVTKEKLDENQNFLYLKMILAPDFTWNLFNNNYD